MSDVGQAPPEREHFDRKSLRAVLGSSADFYEIAKACVCFTNGNGGALWLGIEDGQVGKFVAGRPRPGRRGRASWRPRGRQPNSYLRS